MPGLTRNAAPLLRTVKNAPHATRADHHDDPPSTSPRRTEGDDDNEDIYGSPISSGDEAVGTAAVGADAPVSRTVGGGDERGPAAGLVVPHQHEAGRTLKGVAGEKKEEGNDIVVAPTADQSDAATSSSNSSSSSSSDDNDRMMFSSQASRVPSLKRRRGRYTNIHALPAKTYGTAARKRPQQQQQQQQQPHRREEQADFKKARLGSLRSKEDVAQLPQWRVAKGANEFELGKLEPKRELQNGGGGFHAADYSSLSSLSSPPGSSLDSGSRSSGDDDNDEEKEDQQATSPQPPATQAECAICGLEVDILLRQAFEDEVLRGREPMSYKWQRRFCTHHRRHEARGKWKERGYPTDIHWEALEERMRNHHAPLRDVLSGKSASRHRDALRDRVSERGARTVVHAVGGGVGGGGGGASGGGKRGVSVGYYGPRGEKVMTDHILTHLAVDLRRRATRDKLVAASGISGGVSGFVQAVLVPELAERLIGEDMGATDDELRRIVAESAELGELLHPETEERVEEEEMEVDER